MKNNIFTLLIITLSFSLWGQVAIGTNTPHSSTVLEVSSSDRNGGLLLPKVSLDGAADTETIPNPARGLMVYNLNEAGSEIDEVKADNIYLWDGARWNNLSDLELVKNTLLPPVFFAQATVAQTFTTTELARLNDGTGALVTFPNNSAMVNNGSHIELNSNHFIIKSAGQYELSAYINYIPRLETSTGYSNLDFRIQLSRDNGSTWTTIATTREVWGRNLGQYYRSVIMPPSIIQNLNTGDRIRLMIARADNYGTAHGSGGGTPAIGAGLGITYPKSIKFLKLN